MIDDHAILTLSEVKEMLGLGPVPTAPTAAMVVPDDPGNVDIGTHSYKVTFVSGTETEGGDASIEIDVIDNAVNGKVFLTEIPTGPIGTTARKIYRTRAGNSAPWKLLTTLADNTTTTYTDDTADADLGVNVPYGAYDARLEQAINDVTQILEAYCETAFIQRTITNEEHPWNEITGTYPVTVQPPGNFIIGMTGDRYLRLGKGPVVSVTQIIDQHEKDVPGEGQVYESDLYYLIHKYGVVRGIISTPFDQFGNVTAWYVTYVAGMFETRDDMAADLGGRDILRAAKMMVARSFTNSTGDEVLSKTVGPVSYTLKSGTGGMGASIFLNDEAKRILDPYRRISI